MADEKPTPTQDTAAAAGDPAGDDGLDFNTMSADELSEIVERAVMSATERADKPKESDPLEAVPDEVRPIAEKAMEAVQRVEKLEQREAARVAATKEAERINEITAAAKEFKMTKEELLAVGAWADANPDKAAVLDFRTMALVQNPDLLKRAIKPATPAPKESAQGGPAPAEVVEVGSGGDKTPQEWKPGPGHGFGDITKHALQTMAGTFMTET